MRLKEQRILFGRANQSGYVTRVNTINVMGNRLMFFVELTRGDTHLGTFYGLFSRFKMWWYCKPLECPGLFAPLYEWHEFFVNNYKVIPEYMPLNEI